MVWRGSKQGSVNLALISSALWNLRQSAHLPVGEMASLIANELKNWIDNAAQYDDLTFILVKVNSEPGLTTGP